MFFGTFISYFVVFSLYLSITKKKKRVNRKKKILLLISIKVDKGQGGGHRRWIKKFLNVNIINFAEVDKGGGSKTPFHQKWIIYRLFLEPFP